MNPKKFETLFYSSAGVVAMFVVMLAFYIVTSAAKVRVDVTSDKAHTLSDGTKKILARLDSRVTIRFYCTQGDNAMPPALRTYGQRIEDLLAEYKQAAPGKIVIQKLDPKPDSEAEDSARLNGIEGQATGPFGANKIYLGIVVSLFDQKFTLPWLPPDRDQLLEYEVSRAIARVADRTPPVVGIMSAYPVFGQSRGMMMLDRDAPTQEPWAFVSELKKDFAVKSIPMSATKIDDEVKVLVVEHPRNISDATQYAIDQFVLRGGKLLAFLDPHAYFDQSHEQGNQAFQVMGDAYGQSSLDKLLKAWGLEMDMNKVAVDLSFAGRNSKNGQIMPALLLVTQAGINPSDPATSRIDNLMMPLAGAFTGHAADGLRETVLVRCSTNSQLVDSLVATAASEQILRDFKASNVEYPLAVHLTGKFHTAFPGGKPKAPGAAPETAKQLMESTANGEVVLVADSDMLNDKVCVRAQTVMGQRIVHPLNGNLNLVQSVVELFSGDDDLISARSRASMNRPFTRLKDMEDRASRQWQQKIQELEARKRETDKKIAELQTHKEGSQEQDLILSAEQQKELDDFQRNRAEIGRDLKGVRKNLRKDTDALEFWTKVANIAAVPVLVAVSGIGIAFINPRRRTAK